MKTWIASIVLAAVAGVTIGIAIGYGIPREREHGPMAVEVWAPGPDGKAGAFTKVVCHRYKDGDTGEVDPTVDCKGANLMGYEWTDDIPIRVKAEYVRD